MSSRSFSLYLLLATAGCSITPTPAVKPLAARVWPLPDAQSFEEIAAEARALADELGYGVAEGPDGLFLRSQRFYASEIDRYCIYPIINSKTGGRFHTFATWQVEMNRSPTQFGRAYGLIEIQILPNEPIRATTFCRALTQLGVQPAESTGLYEQEFLQRLSAVP